MPFLGLAFLMPFLKKVGEWLVLFFIGSGFAKFAQVLTTATFVIGLFVAFTAGAYALILGVTVVMPAELGFGMGFLPPSTPLLVSTYYSILVSKRIYDWVSMIYKSATQPLGRYGLM